MILGVDGRAANTAQRAGIGNYTHGLLGALLATAGQDVLRVYLDAPPRPGFPVPPESAEIRILPARRLWSQRTLRAELHQDPPHVLLSPTLQLPLSAGCPMVATVHDLAFLSFPGEFPWRRRWLARLRARHAVRRAAHLIADSAATRADLLRNYPVAEERVTVAHAGFVPALASPVDATEVARVRRAHELPGPFVLYLGRLQPRKNLPRLIAAFEQVCAAHPELPHHLVLAGAAGWMERSIHAAVAASPLRDRIHLPGFVPEADLPVLLQEAEVLALVSLWEGFGLPVLEAMACGTPVLCSNCSSLPEVAGDAAVLVDTRDTGAIAAGLARLLCDAELRAGLRACGPERAAQFSWEATAQTVWAAVRRLRV